MKKPLFVGVAVVACLSIGAYLSISSNASVTADSVYLPSAASDTSVKAGAVKAPAAGDTYSGFEEVLPYTSEVAQLPDSLRGSRLDHELAIDADGNLRVSSDVRMVFDFFLAAIHEEELDTIVARIQEYLAFQLQEPALSQATQLLAQYIGLKEALMQVEEQQSAELEKLVAEGTLREHTLALLQNQLASRNALRAEHLGAEAHEAFFAREEEYDAYTLGRMAIMGDATLTAAEQQAALQQLDATAPPELIASREETQIIETFQAREASLRDSGASTQDIDALRTEMFGAESVDRFHALEQSRQEWQNRLNHYLAQRRSIIEQSGLAEPDQQAQIDALRQAQFDEREQIRVRVYERQDDQRAG